MAQIRLVAQQIHDLEVIRELGEEPLSVAVRRMSALSPSPLKAAELLVAMRNALDGDDYVAACVMRQCLWMQGVMRASGVQANEMIAGIRANLSRSWTAEEMESWNAVEPRFLEFLDVPAVRLVATVIDLAYEYANLYRSGRILTDIRPVFTRDASAIEGAVVSFTLRLRYDNVAGDHDLSVAMDEDDVRALAAQCERALAKSRTAKAWMTERAAIPTVVTGESDDA